MSKRVLAGIGWAVLLAVAGAGTSSGAPRVPVRLSARYPMVVAHFDSIVSRVPRDSVGRWLDGVEAAAPGDSDLRVLTRAQRAMLLIQRGFYDRATQEAQPALARSRATRDTALECRAQHVVATAAALGGGEAAARPEVRRLLLLARAARRPRDVAQARNLLAYLDLLAGRHAEAERGYRAAIRGYSATLDVIPRRIARVGLARALFQSGRYEEACRADVELIRESRRVRDSVNEAFALNNLAVHSISAGDPSDAVPCYERALELHRANHRWKDAFTTCVNLADALERLHRHDEAAAVLESIADTARAGLSPSHRVSLLTGLGLVRLQQGRQEAGLELIARAWSLCDSARLEPSFDLVTARGHDLARRGQMLEAVALLERWTVESHPGDWTDYDVHTTRAGAADILMGCERFKEALPRWEDVRAHVDTTTVAGRRIAAFALLGEARAALGAHSLGRARTALRAAVAMWERARSRTRSVEWRVHLETWGSDSWGVAAGALLACEPGERPEDRARETFDLLQRVKARTLEERSAAGAALRPLDAKRLQREVLREGELALDFFPARDSVFVFAVTRRSLRVVVVRDLPQLRERLARFSELARDRSPDAAALRDGAAAGIAAALLGPVSDLVASNRSLLVSGSGVVDDVAWALIPEPGGSRPLIERAQVASVPSFSSLARVRSRPVSAAPRGPLVLSGPVGADGRRLAGVEAEVRWISGRYASADVRTSGSAGGLSAALGAMPAVDAIHIAAHFAADAENPWRTGVLLGDPKRDDSWIRPAALAPVRTRARLVVLAGCASASARGPGLDAERGLASAFVASGAGVVLGTLWPVEDRASAELVRRFYQALDEGDDAGRALARAQLGMRGAFGSRDPALWAGFILLGDPSVRLRLPQRATAIRPVASVPTHQRP
jgi:tetratricopeptide (TPR) repeat protein